MTPADTTEQTTAKLIVAVDRVQADSTQVRRDLAAIRSQLNALDDSIRTAAKGPLNEVARLKQQMAVLEASNKVTTQANIALKAENEKLVIDNERARNLISFLKQMKGGPSAVLDMPTVRQATSRTTVAQDDAQDDAELVPEEP
ncbi:hypothetical protein PHSY_007400 [Pseudozyma hubeiensis SY62]|uniref:Uncharacterized protein n=1 Tax=Pseudozyma hubeiensis (strain SY62) TaxID=1305764 RepID=R9PEX7_PSEHS|nr:hypothetical protein PHSY_007400 [Pseudozyma hubeiensis SY62]GAC99797.1 hypothetical protein PHSY_007400 [Pseudozyma hubeiensis SY62]